jgi:hypothetical protein
MDDNTTTNEMEEAAGYHFSNFYCHPDFLNGKIDSTLSQVFGSAHLHLVQSDQSPYLVKIKIWKSIVQRLQVLVCLRKVRVQLPKHGQHFK